MQRTFRNIVLSPWWLVQIFSQSKSFAGNPILGNQLLNRLGLHVGRIIAAHAARRIRLALIAPFVDKKHRQAYWRDGFVLVENFLPTEEFAELCADVTEKAKTLEVRECIQGDTLTHRVLLDETTAAQLPGVNNLIESRRYLGLMAFVGATWKRPLFYIQQIANGFAKGAADPQKVLHSDTFHPTMKAWFFLDDVPLENGPFNYVPGSHRLTKGRLKWEYQRSINIHQEHNTYSKRGSMRADDDDLKVMGYGPRRAVSVKKNTLVVADTHGFHCRGQAQNHAKRLELWAFCRTNPFSIFSGIGSRLASRIENRGAKALWRYEDKKAAARNSKSSWHLVDAGKAFSDKS